MRQVNAAEILDIAMAGTSATLLAKRWESALLVNVDNDTLARLLASEEAMDALMRIEGFRSLNADIETIINKSNAVKKGLFSRFIEFSDSANLIHSKQNSKGKTTLLRFLLYSLGYNIPNTRKIKFGRCEVETVICTEKMGEVTLSRTANSHIVLSTSDERTTYVLPEQQNELHSLLFGTNNIDILENLLGAFYVDQEKGWTLLNRGVAIGSIRFSIEELIRGLSGRDCTALIQQESKPSRELGKYKQMFSVAQYQEAIETEEGALAVEHYDEKIDSELEQLKI